MKKIYAFCAAALMSASMFAAVPTEADLAKTYDLQNNVVLCVQFIDEATVCRDIRFVGSSNNWGKGEGSSEAFANCEKFVLLPGFEEDGWYAAELEYSDGFYGKPMQETEDGAWSWDWQPGKPDAWVHVGGNEATLNEENGTETSAGYGSAGAYIYQIKYWKNHKNPCVPAIPHHYSITLYAPDACAEMKPAIAGDDMGWSSNEMSEELDEDFNTVYVYSFVGQEGHSFKFKELTDTDWSNEMQYKDTANDEWVNGPNHVLTADSVIVLDYSDNALYRFAQCKDEPLETVAVFALLPAGAPASGVEIIGTFNAWADPEKGGEPVVMEINAEGAYVATVQATQSDQFKFREAGTWDNEILQFVPANEEGQEGKWDGLKNIAFGKVWKDGEGDLLGKKVVDIDFTDPAEYCWKVAEGIENIVLTEKAQKVVVDGVLYIVRDNKMFNVQGAQVR